MKLRSRQVVFSDRCHEALEERKNTIGVAPTGAGKTVMLSHIIGRRAPRAALVLQHRDELVAQNRRTYELVNPGQSTGLYTAGRKEWGYQATFAMVQTLSRAVDDMPPFDILAIDEGHHAAAPSYRRIIEKCYQNNPDMKLLLVTATPNRGDKKALRGVVDNCADQITLKELIEAKHLVPPRTFVVDIGVREALSGVRKALSDFDMDAVAKIMDKEVLNDRIVEEWKRIAGNRQTVVFCSTVEHAEHVASAFKEAGVSSATISGDMGAREREAVLLAYDRAQIQVLTNVAVLTEGWDHQPTSCVVLLRPSSFKSTMIQMIGRGLRKVDPERYPGVVKDDCVVIDFGTSLLMHGGIEQEVDIHQEGTKDCPECAAVVPQQSRECPICGHEFPAAGDAPFKLCDECGSENHTAAKACCECGHEFPEKEVGQLGDFVLTEVGLIDASPFRWEAIGQYAGVPEDVITCACAFDTWAMVIHYYGRWHAFGGHKGEGIRHLANNEERLLSLASADDYLREKADEDAGSKTRAWLNMPATVKQCEMLALPPMGGFGLTRYRASAMLTWKFNARPIRAKLELTRRVAA